MCSCLYIHRTSQSALSTNTWYAKSFFKQTCRYACVDCLVRAVTLASRYLIQSHGKLSDEMRCACLQLSFDVILGCGKSRVTHLSRVDLMGRSHEWYTKAYGSILTRSMNKLRDSFIHSNTGPETKV
jgi:hypothetical protein